MSPHSRSRTITPRRRSFSGSPSRRKYGHYAKDRDYSRHTPSPEALSARYGHYSNSKSSSRSESRRYRSPSRSKTRSRSRAQSRSGSRSRHAIYKRYGNREKPKPSRCLGVFGMSVYTTQQKIREIFSKFGPIERIQVVIDAQTGRSRGFCFIYYEELADAKIAKEATCGLEIDDRQIRVAYSITQRPHAPTPGVYMGRATGRSQRSYREEYRPSRRRSSSRNTPRYQSERRRRHEPRSRSRSYTPRRSRY